MGVFLVKWGLVQRIWLEIVRQCFDWCVGESSAFRNRVPGPEGLMTISEKKKGSLRFAGLSW